MTIDSFTALFITLAFVIPGFIVTSIMRKLTPHGVEDIQISVLRFITASCVNYGVWSWLIFWIYQSKYFEQHPFRTGLIWLLVIFISPIILGVLWGVERQFQLIERLLGKAGIRTIHTIPTSWDYKFSRISEPLWILVTLKDNSIVAGYWGPASFTSSDINERDIYIEKVYKIASKGPWEPTPDTNDGILISGDQVKTVEFFRN